MFSMPVIIALSLDYVFMLNIEYCRPQLVIVIISLTAEFVSGVESLVFVAVHVLVAE